MDRVILLGNGFNISLREFVSDENVKEQIEAIIKLWNEFDKLVENNKEFIEKILEDLNKSFYILSIIKPFYENGELKNCLDKLKEQFHSEFIDRLWDIVFEFIKQENNNFYRELANYFHIDLFPKINPYKKISEKGNIDIYTTNYDGIAEILFGYDAKEEQGYNKIKLRDMFRGCDGYPTYVCFSEDGYREDLNEPKLLHLHGSYKFYVYDFFPYWSYKEIKVSRDYLENFVKENKTHLEPIIILNAPKFKEKQIKNFHILNTYLKVFEENIKKTNTLVVWGQSLENDPHIKKIIDENFINNRDEERKIIIIDVNENHVLKKESKIPNLEIEFINPKERNFINIIEYILS